MKIRFAIISPELFSQVRMGVDVLLHAVNIGNMSGVDSATAHLLKITADCVSIDLSEDEWYAFFNEIRTENPDFQSGYLLSNNICAPLFPTIAESDCVLELPIDEFTEGRKLDV